jgi:hypothetical protein
MIIVLEGSIRATLNPQPSYIMVAVAGMACHGLHTYVLLVNMPSCRHAVMAQRHLVL